MLDTARSVTRAPERSPLAWPGPLVAAALVLTSLVLAALPLRWSATLLIGVALSVAVLLRPAVGLVALAFVLPFGSLLGLPGLPANADDLLVALVAGAWALRGLAERRLVVEAPAPVWPLLLFVWVAALSLLQAVSWREGLPEWLKWAEVAVLYVAAANLLDRRWAGFMLVALICAGVAQVMVGAFQFVRQIGPEAFVLMERFMRAHGTFGQPNPYAGYLGYLAPITVSMAIMLLGAGLKGRKWSWLFAGIAIAAAAAAMIAGIGMSWSRGAWVALGAALLVVVGFRSRRSAALTLTALLFAGLLIVVSDVGWLSGGVASRLGDLREYMGGIDPAATEITDANFSVLERVAHWRVGLAMFADHPWLGVGIGNYAATYPQYAPPHWYEPLGHAHNIALHLLAETGILGGLAFLGFWMALLLAAIRGLATSDPFCRALAIGLIGTWTYLSLHGMFDNLFVQHMQLQIALLWGALAAISFARASTRGHFSVSTTAL